MELNTAATHHVFVYYMLYRYPKKGLCTKVKVYTRKDLPFAKILKGLIGHSRSSKVNAWSFAETAQQDWSEGVRVLADMKTREPVNWVAETKGQNSETLTGQKPKPALTGKKSRLSSLH